MNEPDPDSFFDSLEFDDLIRGLLALDPPTVRRFARACAQPLRKRGLWLGLSDLKACAWAEGCIRTLVALLPTRVAKVREKGLKAWVLGLSAGMIIPGVRTVSEEAALGGICWPWRR